MVAIETKYIGATDRKGSRIKASANGFSVTISYPHEFDTERAHAEAALALCRKMKWTSDQLHYATHLIAGGTAKGYVFVFAMPAYPHEGSCYALPNLAVVA